MIVLFIRHVKTTVNKKEKYSVVVVLVVIIMSPDAPLTESVYVPLLLCIQFCLVIEVVALWLSEPLVALALRCMIGGFVYLTHCLANHNTELRRLLSVIAIQDIIVLTLTQGLFSLYVWLAVIIPTALYHRDFVRDSVSRVHLRYRHFVTPLYYNRSDDTLV